MAHIRKRENKKSTVYQIKVYDHRLPNNETSMTYKPDKDLTEKQALKEAARQGFLFEEKVKRRLDLGLGEGLTEDITFEEFAEMWFDIQIRLKEMKNSSIERLKGLKERTYDALGKIRVKDLTVMAIQKFIISLSQKGVNRTTGGGLSTKTQKHYISFISEIMTYAQINNLISNNPCRGVRPVKNKKTEKNIYTFEENLNILSKLENAPIQHKAFFYMLIYTGMRRGELLGLEWKDIDIHTGTVSIVRTSNYVNKTTGVYTDTPKTEKSVRTVNIPREVSSVLLELYSKQQTDRINCGDQWEDSDRLFIQWNGRPVHPNTPYTWFERFCKRENIEFKGLHSFRHSYITIAIMKLKIPTPIVSRNVGHSNISTTLNVYTHTVDESGKLVSDKMSGLYSTKLKKEESQPNEYAGYDERYDLQSIY